MKRIMLDTNIYEFILKYIEKDKIKDMIEKQILVIYGLNIIRRELRDIPKDKIRIGEGKIHNLRVTLLSLYDFFVGSHQYKLTNEMSELADKYYRVYKVLDGNAIKKEIITDLIIVACASLHNLDIVVSEDNKTMLSEKTINAYKSVNTLERIRSPLFIGFKKFVSVLRGVNFD